MLKRYWQVGLALASLLVVFPVAFYLWRAAQRPPRTELQQDIAPGIAYHRWFQRQPHPVLWHLVSIDLRQPGLEIFVTPGEPGADGFEIAAQTTSAFLRASGAQVAINGSFFQPFYTRHPLDFYPRPGDRVNAIGQVIANRRQYSPPEASWPVLCVAPDGQAVIQPAQCPPQTAAGLAGSPILVQAGETLAAAIAIDDVPRPRTAVGVNATGDRLWWLVADGRQPLYSRGATFAQIAAVLRDRGAATVLNLDGGGSVTLVRATAAGPQVLNAPIHTRIPARERPVANHLGGRVLP